MVPKCWCKTVRGTACTLSVGREAGGCAWLSRSDVGSQGRRFLCPSCWPLQTTPSLGVPGKESLFTRLAGGLWLLASVPPIWPLTGLLSVLIAWQLTSPRASDLRKERTGRRYLVNDTASFYSRGAGHWNLGFPFARRRGSKKYLDMFCLKKLYFVLGYSWLTALW